MLNAFIFPFKFGIQEIKKDNAFRKTVQSKVIKSIILGFIGQAFMFLFIMSVMYMALSYIVVVTIFFDLVTFVVFPFILLMTWFFIALFKNVFPKVKKNFLKHRNVYEEYRTVTNRLGFDI